MSELLCNEEYEKCLIAIALLDNEKIDFIEEHTKGDEFFNARNRYIFTKIHDLWKKDHCVNSLSLLNNDKRIDPVFIAEVTSSIASVQDWEFYAKKVHDYYLTRVTKTDMSEIYQNLTPDNLEDSLVKLQSITARCTAGKMNISGSGNVMITATEIIQKNFKNGSALKGFACGFEKLDTILDGFQKGSFYVLGARPSIGKTAFAMAVVAGLARNKVKTSVFSLEMTATSLGFRMIASEANLPMWQIEKGFVMHTPRLMERTQNAISRIFEYPITYIDSGVDNDKKLYAQIRHEARVRHSDVILIDHIGLVDVSDSSGQRYVDVGRISKTLQNMSRELNVCIIVLAQCGREAEGKKPNAALLRESGNIEQDADVVMLLHRQRSLDDSKDDDPTVPFPTDVIVDKNRNGARGTAHFNFYPACMRFEEDKSNRSNLDELGALNTKINKQENKNEIQY